MTPPLSRPAIRPYLRLRGQATPQHVRALTLPFPPHADEPARERSTERMVAQLAAQPGFLGAQVQTDAAGHPVVVTTWSSAAQANYAMRAVGGYTDRAAIGQRTPRVA